MKIYTLAYVKGEKKPDKPTSIDMIEAAALARGHEFELILARNCQALFLSQPSFQVNGVERNDISLLLHRPNFKSADVELHQWIVNQFDLMGISIINPSRGVQIAKSKLRQLQLFTKHDVPMPRSCVIQNGESVEHATKNLRGDSFIIKILGGSQGIGVMIAESKRSLRSVVDLLTDDENASPIIIQEYIKEGSGKDLRLFVIGDEVVAAMERTAANPEEFRSNFSLGGSVAAINPTQEEIDLALRASKLAKLDIAGVDIIRTNEGPKLLEINSSPGLEGITTATGIDIAGKIVDYYVAVAEGTAHSYGKKDE